MRKLKILLVIIILLFTFPLLKGEKKVKKIQIELFGGYSNIDSSHLNMWPEYQEGRDNFYTTERYEYYHLINSDYFTYEGEINGSYKKIKNGIPFGGRVKYLINPSFAISLGFKYFYKKQISSVESDYNFNSYYSGEYSLYDISDPFYIYSEGFTPQAGVHYIFKSSSLLEIEGFFNVGILFASCGMTYDNYSKSTYDSGYISEREEILQYTGTGNSIAAEAGFKVNINISRSLGVFAEGGYSYQRVNNITGEGSYKYAEKDSNSDGFTESWNWTGTWKIINNRVEREWGTWNYSYYSLQENSTNSDNFILDLSGFFLRIGISLKL